MAVFRVEKTKGYTVMSNHHLRNKSLTLKAKGLLSQILSLPDDWDYTLAGLSQINREKIDAIRQAVRELEEAGYIVRTRTRDAKGCLRGADYVIYEQPRSPISDLPVSDNPMLENPTLENPVLENPMELSIDESKTDESKKEKLSTHTSSTDSIPIPSLPMKQRIKAASEGTETGGQAAYGIYKEIIKENIEYDHFIDNRIIPKDRLDEIVDIMLETICTARKTLRIAGDDLPAELVKAKFMKLDSSHIEFIVNCMNENTSKIRNIKQYLRAVLFNAPSTIDHYYTALVAHDMAHSLDAVPCNMEDRRTGNAR